MFAIAPIPVLIRLLGLFLLGTVAYRHTRVGKATRMPLRAFAALGAITGFLSALFGSVGPLMAPFLLAHGLVRGAYIGTEALATVFMHAAKLAAYGGTAVLTPRSASAGPLLGAIMVLGSFTGKRIVDRVSERAFVLLIEAVLVSAGVLYLIRG